MSARWRTFLAAGAGLFVAGLVVGSVMDDPSDFGDAVDQAVLQLGLMWLGATVFLAGLIGAAVGVDELRRDIADLATRLDLPDASKRPAPGHEQEVYGVVQAADGLTQEEIRMRAGMNSVDEVIAALVGLARKGLVRWDRAGGQVTYQGEQVPEVRVYATDRAD